MKVSQLEPGYYSTRSGKRACILKKRPSGYLLGFVEGWKPSAWGKVLGQGVALAVWFPDGAWLGMIESGLDLVNYMGGLHDHPSEIDSNGASDEAVPHAEG